MKRMPAFYALCFLLAVSVSTFADIARPSPTPQPGKVIFHTSMTVIPDKNARDARLQISQDSLNDLKAALANTSADNSLRQRIANSPTRTVIAGLCLFLSLSIGGIWLMRSAQPRGQKTGRIVAAWCCRYRRRRDNYAGECRPASFLSMA